MPTTSSGTLNPPSAYGVGSPRIQLAPPPIIASRAPTSTDINYPFGQLWVNNSAGAFYGLSRKTAGAADWEVLGGSSVAIDTLTGDSGGAIGPTAGNVNILGGTGCNVVGSGSTLTINVTGLGTEFTVVTADTAMAVNQGYITNKAGTAASMTLPATASVGSQVTVLGLGATGWVIAQNAGQTVHMNATNSTAGAGGSTTNTSRYQSITLICVIANTDWEIVYTSDAVTIV